MIVVVMSGICIVEDQILKIKRPRNVTKIASCRLQEAWWVEKT